MLRDPEAEREQYNHTINSKTHTDALQSPLNKSTKPSSNKSSNEPQIASQEELSPTTKQTQSSNRKFIP